MVVAVEQAEAVVEKTKKKLDPTWLFRHVLIPGWQTIENVQLPGGFPLNSHCLTTVDNNSITITTTCHWQSG